MFPRSLILKSRVAAAARAHFRAVRQRRMPHARVLPASRANQHHVGNLQWAFLLQNATFDILRRVRARVFLDDVGVLDRDGALRAIHRKHFSGLALRPPGHHFHHVAVTNAQRRRLFVDFSHRYHTSGPSETILVKFFSRSSLATGPNTRVPIGSFASLINTAALSSKRM